MTTITIKGENDPIKIPSTFTPIYNSDDIKTNLITIKFTTSTYSLPITLPAGGAFKLTSTLESGTTISTTSNRCLTANGLVYLEIDNIKFTKGNGVEFKPPTSLYLPDSIFSDDTSVSNGGGVSICGSTIIKLTDIQFDSCTATGSGGGLYIDPSYKTSYEDNKVIKSYFDTSTYPPASFLIYTGGTTQEFFKPSGISNNKPVYTSTSTSKTISYNTSNEWVLTGTTTPISLLNTQYSQIPYPSEQLYIDGYYLASDGKTCKSIQEILPIINKRGYQLLWENNSCSASTETTITKCHADRDGGGVYINNISYSINGQNLKISENNSWGYGGGMCIMNTIDNMYFSTDLNENGIFLNKNGRNMIIQNITFLDNTTSIYGGGLFYGDNYNGIIEKCNFYGNTSNGGGGGGLFVMGNQYCDDDRKYDIKQISIGNDIYTKNNSSSDIEYILNDINKISYDSSSKIWTKTSKTSKTSDTQIYTNTLTYNIYNFNSIPELPPIEGWSSPPIITDFQINPIIRFYLTLKINDCNIGDDDNDINNDKSPNKVSYSLPSIFNKAYQRNIINFDTNHIRVIDAPYNIGGGICVFSCSSITLNNSNILKNTLNTNTTDNDTNTNTTDNDTNTSNIAIFNNIYTVNFVNTNTDDSDIGVIFVGNYYTKSKDETLFSSNNTFNKILLKDNTKYKNIYNPTIATINADSINTDSINKDNILYNTEVNYFSNISDTTINDKINSIQNKFKTISFMFLYNSFSFTNYEDILFSGNPTKSKIGGQDNSIKKLLISPSTHKDNIPEIKLTNLKIHIVDIDNVYISSIHFDSCKNPITASTDNKSTVNDIIKNSGGALIIDNVNITNLYNLIFTECTSVFGGACAFFTSFKSNEDSNNLLSIIPSSSEQTFNLINCIFENCSSTNLGGAIFNYIYETNGIDNIVNNNILSYTDVPSKINSNNKFYTNINLTNNEFKNCSSINRGGCIYTYYNTQLNIINDLIIDMPTKPYSTKYGNFLFMSDQSYYTTNNITVKNTSNVPIIFEPNDILIEGSSCNSIVLSNSLDKTYTPGLVYIDSLVPSTGPVLSSQPEYTYKTDIFKWDATGKCTIGLDLYLDKIKTIPSTVSNENLVYQLYNYDYINNNSYTPNTTGVLTDININNITTKRLLFNSRYIQPTTISTTTIYTYTIFDSMKKNGFVFNQLDQLDINSIKLINNSYAISNSGTDGSTTSISKSIIQLQDVYELNIKNVICDTNTNTVGSSGDSGNGGVFNINNTKSTTSNLNIYNDVIFTNNKSVFGGVLYGSFTGDIIANISKIDDNNPFDLSTTIIQTNSSTSYGGVFYLTSSLADGGQKLQTFTHSDNQLKIIGNNAGKKGGVFYFNNINAEIENLDITGNTASQGGALYLDGNSHITLDNTSITSNICDLNNKYTPSGSFGGGIYIGKEAVLTINDGVDITENTAYWGGGIFYDIDGTSTGFNDTSKFNRLNIPNQSNIEKIKDNTNYDIYFVGLEGLNSYFISNYSGKGNNVLATVDVDITFSDKTKGRYLPYNIDVINTQYIQNNIKQIFGLYDSIGFISTLVSGVSGYTDKISELDIKYYNENFTYKSDTLYSCDFSKTSLTVVNISGNPSINGNIVSGGTTYFQGSGTSGDGGTKPELSFNFNNIKSDSSGKTITPTLDLTIENLTISDFDIKTNTLYNLQSFGSFNYDSNTHSNINGRPSGTPVNPLSSVPTTFNLNDIKQSIISSDYSDCIYYANKFATGSLVIDNNKNRCKGGFLYAGGVANGGNKLTFSPNTFLNIGSTYIGSSTDTTNASSYNIPFGGVLYIENTTTTILQPSNNTYDGTFKVNNILKDNTIINIAEEGGFIYKTIEDTEALTIKGDNVNSLTISNYVSNTAGGAIRINNTLTSVQAKTLIDFEQITITKCSSYISGGGIAMSAIDGTFKGVNITDCNSLQYGGGLAIIGNTDTPIQSTPTNSLELDGNGLIFSGNTAVNGSQISVYDANLTIKGYTFDGSTYLDMIKYKKKNDNTFINNGGAIYAKTSNLTLDTCIFNNFYCYGDGGVIYYETGTNDDIDKAAYNIKIDGCKFNGKVPTTFTETDTLKRGGCIYIDSSTKSTVPPTVPPTSPTGTLELSINNTSINDYTITNCSGGAIFINNNKSVRKFTFTAATNTTMNGNTVTGDISKNLTGNTLTTDLNILEGFGGGIFMNGVEDISLTDFTATNNSSTLKFPIIGDFDYTYGCSSVSTNIKDDKGQQTDNAPTIDPNDANTLNISDPTKLTSWNDISIPTGGFIFMMNGLSLFDDNFKCDSSTINSNTPDNIFPSYVDAGATLISYSDITKTFNKLGSGFKGDINMWSLMNGEKGENTVYSGKGGIKSGEGGIGGIGGIVESLVQITIQSGQNIYISDDTVNGKGGKGGIILYPGKKKQIVSSDNANATFDVSS